MCGAATCSAASIPSAALWSGAVVSMGEVLSAFVGLWDLVADMGESHANVQKVPLRMPPTPDVTPLPSLRTAGKCSLPLSHNRSHPHQFIAKANRAAPCDPKRAAWRRTKSLAHSSKVPVSSAVLAMLGTGVASQHTAA